MRLPRHDTPLSLPACGIAEDEALLDRIRPGDAPLERWWIASQPAVALGLGLHHRLESIVDIERCRAAGLEVLTRRAGGAALLPDENMLCGAVSVPRQAVARNVAASYR